MRLTLERLLSVGSICFQGWSLVIDIDKILYAYVSLTVLAIQWFFESQKSPSGNVILTRSISTASAIMCILSVASNFYGPTIVTAGRFLTTSGVVLESIMLGIEIDKSKSLIDLFGLEIYYFVGIRKPSPKKKKNNNKKNKNL